MTMTQNPPREISVPSAAATPAAPRASGLRHARVLAKRSLIKTFRTPEALVDVTLQPVIFLGLFTYIFGGAIAGATHRHAYLEFLLPGLLGQTIAMASVALGQNLNADIQKGVFDRFRSLPIARSAPLVGAVLADVARYLILFAVMMGFGLAIGFRRHQRRAPDPRRAAAVDGLRPVLRLDLGLHRHDRPYAGSGAGHHVPGRAAAQLRQQHLRQRHDPARLAAGLRQGQPDQPPGVDRARP